MLFYSKIIWFYDTIFDLRHDYSGLLKHYFPYNYSQTCASNYIFNINNLIGFCMEFTPPICRFSANFIIRSIDLEKVSLPFSALFLMILTIFMRFFRFQSSFWHWRHIKSIFMIIPPNRNEWRLFVHLKV